MNHEVEREEGELAKLRRLRERVMALPRYTICGGQMVPVGFEAMHGCWSGGTEYLYAADIDAIDKEVGGG